SQTPLGSGSSYVSRASAAAAARARATSRKTSGLGYASSGAMPGPGTLGSMGSAPPPQSQMQVQRGPYLQTPKRSGLGSGPGSSVSAGGRSGASTPQLRVAASQPAASRRNSAAAATAATATAGRVATAQRPVASTGTGRGVALRALKYTEWLETQTRSPGSMQPQWRNPSERTAATAATAATQRGVGPQLTGRKQQHVPGGGGAGAGAAPRTPPPITPVTAKMSRGPTDTSSVYSTPTAHSPAITSGLPTPPRRLLLPSNSPSRELSFLDPGDSGSGRGSGESDGSGGAFGMGAVAARILAGMDSVESSSINLAAIPSLTTLTGGERSRPGQRMGAGGNGGGGGDDLLTGSDDLMRLPGTSAVVAEIGKLELPHSGRGDMHLYGGGVAADAAVATLTGYGLAPDRRALATTDAAMLQRCSIQDNSRFAVTGIERQKAPKLTPHRPDTLPKGGALDDGYNGTRSHDYLRHHQENVYGGVDSGDTFDGGAAAGGRSFRPSERGEYGLSASDMDESDFDRASILLDDIVRQDSVVGAGQLSPALTLRRMSSMEGGGGGGQQSLSNHGGAAAAAIGSGSSGLAYTGRSPERSTSSRQVQTSFQPRQRPLSGSLLDRTVAAAVAAAADGFLPSSEPGLVVISSPQTSRPPSQTSGVPLAGSAPTARTGSLDPWELQMLGDMAGAIAAGVNVSHGSKQAQGTSARQPAPRVAKVRSFRLRMSSEWLPDEDNETDRDRSRSAQLPATDADRSLNPSRAGAADASRGTSDDGGGGDDRDGGGSGGVAAVAASGEASTHALSHPEQGPAFAGGGSSKPRGQSAPEGHASHGESVLKPARSQPGGSFWSASSYGGGAAAGRGTGPVNVVVSQQQQLQQQSSKKQLHQQQIHHSHIRQESSKQPQMAGSLPQPAQSPPSGLPAQASINSRLSPTTSAAQTPSGNGTGSGAGNAHQARNGSPVVASRPALFAGLNTSPAARVGMPNETPAQTALTTLARELHDSTTHTTGAGTGTPGVGFHVGMGSTVWSPGSRPTSGGLFMPRASHGTLNSPVSAASEIHGGVRGSISGASNFSALSGPQAGVIYNYPSHGYVERAAEYGRWEAAMMYDLDLYSSMQLQGNPSPDEYDDPSYLARSQTGLTSIPSSTVRPFSTGVRPIVGSGADTLLSNPLGMQHASPSEPEVRRHMPPRRSVSASASMLAAAAASGAAFPGPGLPTRGPVPLRLLMRSSRSWSPLRFSSTAATVMREAGAIAPGSPRGRVAGESILEVLDQILEEESSGRLSSVMIERTPEAMSPGGPNSATGVPPPLLSTDSFTGNASPREPSLGAWPSFRQQTSRRRSGSSDGRLNFNVGRIAAQHSDRPSIEESVPLPPLQQKVDGSGHGPSSTGHAHSEGPQRADSMTLGDALLKALDGPQRCVSPPLLSSPAVDEASSIGVADNIGGRPSTLAVTVEPRLALSARPQNAPSSSSTASSPRAQWHVDIGISTCTSSSCLPEAARNTGAAAAVVTTAVHSRSPRGNGGRPQLASYVFPPTIPEEILSHPLSSSTMLSPSSSATGSAISSMVQIQALPDALQQQHLKQQQEEQEKGQVQQLPELQQQQQHLQALQVQEQQLQQQQRSQGTEVLSDCQRSGSGLGSNAGRRAALLRARSGPLTGPQLRNEGTAVSPLLNRRSDGGSSTAAVAAMAAAAAPNASPRPRTAPNVGDATNLLPPSAAADARGSQLLSPSIVRGSSVANVSERPPQVTGATVDGADSVVGSFHSASFHRRPMQPLPQPDSLMRADKAVGNSIWGSSSPAQELLYFQSQAHSQQPSNMGPLQRTRSDVHAAAPSSPLLEPPAPQQRTSLPLGAATTATAGRYPPPSMESIQRLLESDLPSPAIAAAVGVLAGSLPQTWVRQHEPSWHSHRSPQPGLVTGSGRGAGAASGSAAGSTAPGLQPGFRGAAGGTSFVTAAASLQSVVSCDHPDVVVADAESPYNVGSRFGPMTRSYMALLTLAGERGMPPKLLQEDGDKMSAPIGQLTAAAESHSEPILNAMEESSIARGNDEYTKGGIAQLGGDGPLGRAVRLIAQSMLIVLAGAAGATAAASSANAIFMRPEDLPYEHGTSIYYTKYPRQKRFARTLYK
ncbi:hypothetical protein Vretifemale_14580, partial [Volvox reticuliferus]